MLSAQNFHVYYKAEDTTLDAMTLFVKAFRERYCTRQSNVSLYNVNNEYLMKLIKTYPLQGEDLAYMRKHFLATSMFEVEYALWQNLYD